jgi:DNA-binding transcriptional LysR family regulator
MDLDLRKVRYFAELAQQQHFGRAAELLHIAQPVLSRQIRALEAELGCDLLERTTRSVTLTPAGLQLHRTAPELLAASNSTVRGVHEVARGTKHLAVGFAPGLSIAPAIQAFEDEHPEVEVDLVRLNWYEQGEALADGRIDVGYLRRPFDDRGLHTIPIGEEGSVVFLPSTHELAGRDFLLLADLDGEKVLDGERRHTSTIEEKLELVAAGHGVAILPESVGKYYSSENLSRLPLTDAPAHPLCLAALSTRRQPHLRAFIHTAMTVLSKTR